MGSLHLRSKPHFLFVAAPVLSHTRPLLNFAWNLLHQNPELQISVVYPSLFEGIFEKEVHLRQAPEESAQRFHRCPLEVPPESSENHSVDYMLAFQAKLPDVLQRLHVDKQHLALAYPSMIVVDLLLSSWPDIMQDVAFRIGPSFQHIPYHLFTCTPAAWGVRRGTAPGCAKLKMLQTSNSHNKTQDELIEQAFRQTNGTLIHITSVGDVYDYELRMPTFIYLACTAPGWLNGSTEPQMGAVPFDSKMVPYVMHAGWAPHVRRYDGVIVATSAELEPGAKESLQALLNKPVYQIGPQFSEAMWQSPPQLCDVSQLKPADQDTISFLNGCYNKYGRHSVVYISFGTFYGMSSRPDLIELLLQTLLHSTRPFVYAVNKLKPHLSDTIKRKIEQSDVAHMIDFAPQHHILAHPATGWFLTHCGQSSVAESILFGVPMICWPCMTDQPITALQLSVSFQLAFELIQVRTGDSEGRPTARGVEHKNTKEAIVDELQELWIKTQSKEGDAMRSRVLEMRDRIQESWTTGFARQEMQRFKAFMA